MASFACFGAVSVFTTTNFVYEDVAALVQNKDVTNTTANVIDSFNSILQHDTWGREIWDDKSHKAYRPFATIIYNLFHRFVSLEHLAPILKVVNLFGHAINCCVMFSVLRRVLHECEPKLIFVAVTLFAVHPIHTEVICSAVGLSDLLCAYFFLRLFKVYVNNIESIKWFSYFLSNF